MSISSAHCPGAADRAWSATQTTRLIIGFLAVLITVTGLLQASGARREAIEAARFQAMRITMAVDGFLYQTQGLLGALAAHPQIAVPELRPSGALPVLQATVAANPSYNIVLLTAINGSSLIASREGVNDELMGLGGWDCVQRVMETGQAAVASVSGANPPTSMIDAIAAYPVRDSEGVITGVISAGFGFAGLEPLLAEMDLPHGTTVTIVDRAGRRVGGVEAPAVDRRLLCSTPMSLAPWDVAVGIPTAAVYAHLPVLLLAEFAALAVVGAVLCRLVVKMHRLTVELARERALLSQLVDATPVGIAMVTGPDLRHEWVNPTYRQIPGLRDDVLGRPAREVFPRTLAHMLKPLRHELLARKGETVSLRAFAVPADGASDETHWDADFVPLADGGPEGRWLVITRDVTDSVLAHRRIESLLTKSRRRAAKLRAVLRSIGDRVLVIDREGRIATYNMETPVEQESNGALTGGGEVSSSFFSGLRLLTMDGREIPRDQWPSARLLRGEPRLELECFAVTPQGRRLIIATGSTVSGPDGQPELAVVVVRDITEFRRLQQAKDQFLQIMVHELRNPLAVATGLVQLAQRRLADAGVTLVGSHLSMAGSELVRVANLLNDTVKGYEVSSGELALRPETINLLHVIEEALAPHGLEGAQHNLVFHRTPGVIDISGDRRRLIEVLSNLISNAIKYSPPDTTIEVAAGIDQDVREAWIEVADQGIGIPEDQLERVFTSFYRATNIGPAQPGGLGLGLAICRDIIERHGGRIWAQARPEGGTIIGLRLPLAGQG